MMQTREQTYEEKFSMYKKFKKKELIIMLIECERLLSLTPSITYIPEECKTFIPEEGTTAPKCVICGKPSFMHNVNNY